MEVAVEYLRINGPQNPNIGQLDDKVRMSSHMIVLYSPELRPIPYLPRGKPVRHGECSPVTGIVKTHHWIMSVHWRICSRVVACVAMRGSRGTSIFLIWNDIESLAGCNAGGFPIKFDCVSDASLSAFRNDRKQTDDDSREIREHQLNH